METRDRGPAAGIDDAGSRALESGHVAGIADANKTSVADCNRGRRRIGRIHRRYPCILNDKIRRGRICTLSIGWFIATYLGHRSLLRLLAFI